MDAKELFRNREEQELIKYLHNGYDTKNDPEELLYLAVYYDLEELALECLKLKMDPNTPECLIRACRFGSIKLVKALVEAGADVNFIDEYNTSPLKAAAGSKRISFIKYLRKQGAIFDDYVIWGALNGSEKGIKILKYLLDEGVDIESKSSKSTPLMSACHGRDSNTYELVSFLINSGANVNARKNNRAPILSAAQNCGSDVIQALIDNGANVDEEGDQSALMLAAREGNVEAIETLIANGADVHRKSTIKWGLGKNALWFAENQSSARGKARKKTIEILKKHTLDNYEVEEKQPIDFDEISKKYIQWLLFKGPGLIFSLLAKADKNDIDKIESQLGISLPNDLSALYTGCCNGQKQNPEICFFPNSDEWFMNIDLAIGENKQLRQMAARKQIKWKKEWLAFTTNGMGNHSYIITSGENAGKIAYFDHEAQEDGNILYDSLAEWMDETLSSSTDE